MTSISPYNTEKDIGYFIRKLKDTCYIYSSEFLVCWSEDTHLVAIMLAKQNAVSKSVIKIAMESSQV